MSLRKVIQGVAVLTFAAALSAPARADMGLAPVTVQGTYVSFEGGYLLQDADGVIGHGVTSAAGVTSDIIVNPRDGWFAGGMIGFASNGPLIAGLPFRRVEAYGLYGETSASASDTAPAGGDITIKAVDGDPLGRGLSSAATSVDRRTVEGGLRFEYDDVLNATTSVTWVVAPFIRNMQEDGLTACGATCGVVQRSSDTESWLYGVVFAVEPEAWITPGVALVGRLGAGVYGFDTDASFRSSSSLLPDTFAAQFSDGDSGVGFRLVLGAGLKFKLTEMARLETFAEADYFSDVGTAQLSNNDPNDATASHAGTTDLWELRAGARLTIGFAP